MQEAQSAQTAGAVAAGGKFGNDDPMGIAYDNGPWSALAVDEQADLAAQVRAENAQLFGLFQSISAQGGIASLVEAVQRLDLARFEPGGVAVNLSGYFGTSLFPLPR